MPDQMAALCRYVLTGAEFPGRSPARECIVPAPMRMGWGVRNCMPDGRILWSIGMVDFGAGSGLKNSPAVPAAFLFMTTRLRI